MAQAPETSASSQITWVDGKSGEKSSDNSFEANRNNNGNSDPGLTVTFKDVAVEVNGLGQDYGPTVASVVRDLMPSFGKGGKSTRHILQGVSGQVRPGEMLLVLGRPGSGCTSLLKIITNMRDEFYRVTGDVRYGNLGPKQARQFRHQIAMNTEDDLHFPTLKVSETMEFAYFTKTPRTNPEHLSSEDDYVDIMTKQTLSSLGIDHTADTMVGDEFIRGVSGGERKRVSVAEVMSTQATLQCWDNSTRGLDASNALDFAKVLRRAADTQQKSMVATLYQAGNGIFNLFDNVLVLAEGREIYYGPTSMAKQYFEDMGFKCAPGANVADFLTSVAVHTERTIRPGYEDKVPNTAEEFDAAYKNSAIFAGMMRKLDATNEQSLAAEIENLKRLRELEKKRSLPFMSRETSPYQVSFARQVVACTVRQFRILWGDRLTKGLQIASALIVGIVAGSLFYGLNDTTESIFSREGALYYPVLFFGLNCMAEVTASFMGRPIISRHKRFAFARPAAHAIACVLTDIPMIVTLFSLFEIVYYFMVGFTMDAGSFFTQWFIFILITLCLTSFFRNIGAWCRNFGVASQISGWFMMVLMVYAGYLIPVPRMHVWFRWISYINPVTYAYGALMGSSMSRLKMECVEPQYVPYGPGYDDNAYRSCTLEGSTVGSSIVSGENYLVTEYGDTTQHVWRNVGIIIAFWVFFALMAAIGFEVNLQGGAGSKVLFDRRSREQELAQSHDIEKVGHDGSRGSTSGEMSSTEGDSAHKATQTIFTFRDISYYVHHAGKEKQLLQDVTGFVKPGKLVALMGSSGAGKTTLMDVLAQRKDSGRLEGHIKVNGKPQGISFQRETGYCEQNDVHEPTSTVREALLFSARLRQSHEIPDEEKVAYVDHIMDLLELGPLQHAIVGTPGSGLSIEQRKRLTIATELVAKPSLLFLDEPTSGLDGQSAYEICRFMRKLASAGLTIIATIHQPSAALFESFDVLLLLARGGKTTYFGPTGKESADLLQYFAENGAPCPPETNPAEHIVDVVQGRLGTDADWPQIWLNSPQRQQAMQELEQLEAVQPSSETPEAIEESNKDFATPLSYQISMVTKRQLTALWRNPDYIWNKIGLHPLFIRNRDIFETREKKSKTYKWLAFISAQLIAEIPWLIVCGTTYFCCWYFTSGFPVDAKKSGQAIAAYSPNELFAALANPVLIGCGLIPFSGVLVPYAQMQAFWRYWLYYLNPFGYLIGALVTPVAWDTTVECLKSELTNIPLPSNATCGEYMSDFLAASSGYVVDPSSTTTCEYCPYSKGADYLKTLNIKAAYYGWRDVGITALFCISSYGLVFLMMKLRSKATKTAK
ncbi:Brefeldin A resistance protein [Cytospora mali]|uniref:Brefeldin A resistance protein n=1 Tax=Cytospora mali TaxID=578113 RepID=A0A194VFU2_CYTMA|nr:Brefeldin A resistance protein [Valsa mali var. pyri (nom. inval.)]